MNWKRKQISENYQQWKDHETEVSLWLEDKNWLKQERYRRDQQYMAAVGDVLEHEVFQSMSAYIQHGRTTCREHCIQVSYLSYRICRRFGLDAKAAARAGLLHDMFLYDWHTHGKETGKRFHGFTHPATALKNAEYYFSLTAKEKNMILRHMWPLTPIPPASREGMVLVYADKFCSSAEIIGHMRSVVAGKFRVSAAS